MPIRRQSGTGGIVFHVMNRGVRRLRLFETPAEYLALLHAVADAQRQTGIRLLAFCAMPNHFHLVAWPSEDGELARFMRLATGSHGRRWQLWRQSSGTGAVYQGRYRAFPIQTDEHFLTVCRYVERNPLRAGLVPRAEDWSWSSLAARCRSCHIVPVTDWPVLRPLNWLAIVNGEESAADLAALRRAARKGIPFGDMSWRERTAHSLGSTAALRPPGRPAKITSGVISK